MNSNERLFVCIFTITAIVAIHFASGLNEPLYFTTLINVNEYFLIYDVRYDVTNGQLVVIESFGGDIFLACPRDDDSNSLEIREKVPKMVRFTPYCATSIKSHAYMTLARFEFLPNVIGFPVFTPNTNPDHYYANVPKNHAVIGLIKFDFDKSQRRVKTVRYRLGAGKFLKPETTPNNEEYKKNEDIFGYDVDQLYSRTKLPLVKVQLAPEDDFFFTNWKSASRHNVLTAPMWRELLPQWQALEIFTRKVTRIIDSVKVITGVHDTLTKHRLGRSPQKLYLHEGKHPIPKYFWKAIYTEIYFGYTQNYFRGILFVMHNVDPSVKSNEQKICPNDDVSKLGWQFLPDNEFKTLMYACSFNEVNFNFFQEKMHMRSSYDPFDLHDVPVEETNDEGKTIGIKRVNAIEEMQKSENTT